MEEARLVDAALKLRRSVGRSTEAMAAAVEEEDDDEEGVVVV
jgi:hypothetical protein